MFLLHSLLSSPLQHFSDPNVGMLLFRTWWYPTAPQPSLSSLPSASASQKTVAAECSSNPSCCVSAYKKRDQMYGGDQLRQACWSQLENLSIEHLVSWSNTVRDPRLRDSRRRAKYALRVGDAISFHIHGPVQVSLLLTSALHMVFRVFSQFLACNCR